MNSRNENRLGYKDTKVGWIPEDWSVSKINSLSDGSRPAVKAGPFGSSLKKEFYVKSGYKIYGQEQVIKNDPYYGDYFIDEEKFQMLKSCEVLPGDILISLVGTLGKILVVPDDAEPGIINPRLLRIHLDINNVSIHFTKYYLTSERSSKLLHRHSQGGTMGVLNAAIVGAFPIPLPPLPEQRKIAEILSAWDRAIELVGKQIAAKQRLKKGLMQQLLTGKFRFPGFNGKWKKIRLGEIGEFSKGSGITKSDLLEKGIPCIRYGEIYTTHNYVIKDFFSFISPEVASTSVQIFLGDILFAGSGETSEEIGKCVAYVGEGEAYAGGDVIILRLSKGDPRYLGYLLNHDEVNRQKYNYGQGHSVVHIYSRFLKDIIIPFPPIEEQKKIAELLDSADQEIDSFYQKVDFLRQQKQGMMQKLLTGEVRVKV